MDNLTVHFKVQDCNAWRTGYNSYEKSRASAGTTNGRVFRSAHDPNDIVVLQDVAEAETRRPACRAAEDINERAERNKPDGRSTSQRRRQQKREVYRHEERAEEGAQVGGGAGRGAAANIRKKAKEEAKPVARTGARQKRAG